MHLSTTGKSFFSVFALAGLFVPGLTGIAQGSATNPGSPALNTNISSRATTPSTSSEFGLKLTACRYTFDWETYFADQEAGRTNSNPYIDQGCVSGENLDFSAGDTYADLEVGQASTKQAFGTDPILGIYTNGDYSAQSLSTYADNGSVLEEAETYERNEAAALDSIFTTSQLDTIYSTGGARTAMPRLFSTGPDEYRTKANGQRVYRGGRCGVEDGEIFVRTERAGEAFNPSLYGIDASNPEEACARSVDGQRLDKVEEQPLKAYQFIYEFTYPSAEQCDTYFGVDENTCLLFFRNRYGRDLAGKGETGNRTLSVYTYYGSFDDQYSQWVGWVNPDINGPRKDSDDGFVRAYDGYSVYAL